MDEPFSRRRFLTLSAAGMIATAGCVEDGGDDGFQPSDGNSDRDDEVTEGGPGNQPSRDPAFELQTGGGERFTDARVPFYEGWESVQYSEHPDTRITSVEVGPSTVTVTVNSMKVNRDIEVSADYLDQNGGVSTTDAVTVSPESDSFQTYEIEIPINGRQLPRREKGIVKILVSDTHEDSQGHVMLKEHRFIAIPYENNQTSSTFWVNDEALNFNYTESTISSPDNLYTERIGAGDQFTRFFALAYPAEEGRIFSAYSNIDRDMYREYRQNREDINWRDNHHPGSYFYHADDFEMFTSMANSFSNSLDTHNIRDQYTRLQKLAHLVGSMEYYNDRINDNQVKTLYDGKGDCTEVTTLYLALLNTSAFNHTRGSMIYCSIPEIGDHAVVGIDERDINHPNSDSIHWHSPSQEMRGHGVPDTRYAVTELTQPRTIGNFNAQRNTIHHILDTTNLDVTPELRDGPG